MRCSAAGETTQTVRIFGIFEGWVGVVSRALLSFEGPSVGCEHQVTGLYLLKQKGCKTYNSSFELAFCL